MSILEGMRMLLSRRKLHNKKITICNIILIIVFVVIVVVGTIKDNKVIESNKKTAISLELANKKQVIYHTEKQAIDDAKKYPYKGKTWNVIGDSITTYNNYQGKVQNLTQLSAVNSYGVSTSCISALNNSDLNAMCIGIEKIQHSADIISIFGGTNDYGTSKTLGNKNDNSITTFCGALKVMLDKLKTENPKSKIVMFTPLQRNWHGQGQMVGIGKNLKNNTLLDYVNAIKIMGKTFEVPVLDLYNESGITEQNIDQYTEDGLNPNEAGFKMISKVMADFINKQ